MLPVLSQSEADLTTCFQQDISGLLDSFSEKDTSSKQSLQQMLSSDQAAFSRASIAARPFPIAAYLFRRATRRIALAKSPGDVTTSVFPPILSIRLCMESLQSPLAFGSEGKTVPARLPIPAGIPSPPGEGLGPTPTLDGGNDRRMYST